MGRIAAEGMLEATDIRTALSWHLTSNHYPPAGFMLQPCIDAIEACAEGDSTRRIDLPVGVEYKEDDVAPAWIIVQSFHLESFLPEE